MDPHRNPTYIHHQDSKIASAIREVVFGLEDGMVSTFGAVTGIAAATHDHFTVVLAGLVVVGVESISMGVGSYLSSKSERAVDERKLAEEKWELRDSPEEEKQELIGMYLEDGWSKPLSILMAEEASQHKELFLKEMAYRELKVFPDHKENSLRNGLTMGLSYIIGGAIPLIPYLLLPIVSQGIWASLIITPIGLFILGTFVTKYSKQSWIKTGFEMVFLGGLAAGIGYIVGQFVDSVL